MNKPVCTAWMAVVAAVVVGLAFGCGGGKPASTSISTFTDTRDGKVYKIVQIGSQNWFAENLNYAAEGSKCYNNSADSCAKYGRLYNWEQAITACPAEFHLPDIEDWAALAKKVGNRSKTGTKLKSSTGWSDNGNGKNNYGFSALPGGAGDGSGNFAYAGHSGYWWSATEAGTDGAMARDMNYYYEFMDLIYTGKSLQYSVRCVADDSGVPNEEAKDGAASAAGTTAKPTPSTSTFADQLRKWRPFQAKPAPNTAFTDSRDGQVYRTVKIGRQIWMAQNLNYEAGQFWMVRNLNYEAWSVCYMHKDANCKKYGSLYNWATALKACPDDWRLPSDEEWTALMDAVGGDSTAGMKLKSAKGWNNKGNGTDEYGWSALPGGDYSDDGFGNAGNFGFWWSATEGNADSAWLRGIYYGGERVGRFNDSKALLFSVRCVKDDEAQK